MKAIVNVNKESAYAKYNGLTFEIVEFLNTMLALNIDGRTTDFNYKEVIILDFQKEMQEAYDDYNWDRSRARYLDLKKYRDANTINFTPKYTAVQ